jgi:hypothetical protein
MDRACSTNGEKRNAYGSLMEKPKEGNHWGEHNVCGWIIIK